MNYIDKKQLVTIVAAAVVIFFLQKWLTKTVTNNDGTVSKYVGHDSVGHI